MNSIILVCIDSFQNGVTIYKIHNYFTKCHMGHHSNIETFFLISTLNIHTHLINLKIQT